MAKTLRTPVAFIAFCALVILGSPVFSQSVRTEKEDQLIFPVGANLSVAGGVGYEVPKIDINAGVETVHNKFLTFSVLSFSPTDKNSYRTSTYNIANRVYHRLDHNFFVGGGLSYSNLIFDDFGFSKSVVRPVVGGGYKDRSGLVRVDYLFSGNDKWNHGRGVRTNFQVVSTSSENFRFEFDLLFFSYDTYSLYPELGRTNAFVFGIGFRYMPRISLP